MKKKILTIFILGIQFLTFSQITFQKEFGLIDNNDYGYDIKQLPSGHYIMLGGKVSYISNEYVGFGVLRELDENGNVIWSSEYLGDNNESLELNDFIITSDNKIITIGTIEYDYQTDYNDVYICKYNMNGNIIWYNNFGGSNSQRGKKIIETSDGGFLIVGFNNTTSSANSLSLYAIKVNSNGILEWEYIQSNNPNDAIRHQAYSVKEIPNGDFIICGRIDQILNNGTDLYAIKLSANGNEIWNNIYDYDIGGELRSISLKNNGNILLSGWIAPNFCAKPIILEIDTNGNLISEHIVDNGICEWSSDINLSPNGDITLLSYDNSNYRLIKFDENFNQIWSHIYDVGNNGNNATKIITQTSDEGYIIIGTSAINSDIQSVVIKTSSTGYVLSVSEILTINNIKVYPNPASQFIKISGLKDNIYKVKIHNSLGQLIEQTIKSNSDSYISLDKYKIGVYYLTIFDGKNLIQTKKIIIK